MVCLPEAYGWARLTFLQSQEIKNELSIPTKCQLSRDYMPWREIGGKWSPIMVQLGLDQGSMLECFTLKKQKSIRRYTAFHY